MVLKKNTKNLAKMTSPQKIQLNSDLLARLEKISEQTGLSPIDLLQKWVFQEETQIGFMQRNKGQMTKTKVSPGVAVQKDVAQDKRTKVVQPDPNSPNYRKALSQKANF